MCPVAARLQQRPGAVRIDQQSEDAQPHCDHPVERPAEQDMQKTEDQRGAGPDQNLAPDPSCAERRTDKEIAGEHNQRVSHASPFTPSVDEVPGVGELPKIVARSGQGARSRSLSTRSSGPEFLPHEDEPRSMFSGHSLTP